MIAAYGVETLAKKNWAIVHSTDAFGTGGFDALSAALGKVGAKVALDQGYPNQGQDFTAVALAIKSSGADVIGSDFTFDNDLAIFARQLHQLGVNLPWVGSPSIIDASPVKLAGPALWGTWGASPITRSIRAPRRRNSRGSTPPSLKGRLTNTAPGPTTRWASSASSIDKAGSTDPGKIRDGIL